MLEIEVQGARQVREAMPEAVRSSSRRPRRPTCAARLEGRATDRPEEIERRLAVAEEELSARREFGHVVVNDDVERATDELVALVQGDRGSGEPRDPDVG